MNYRKLRNDTPSNNKGDLSLTVYAANSPATANAWLLINDIFVFSINFKWKYHSQSNDNCRKELINAMQS